MLMMECCGQWFPDQGHNTCKGTAGCQHNKNPITSDIPLYSLRGTRLSFCKLDIKKKKEEGNGQN